MIFHSQHICIHRFVFNGKSNDLSYYLADVKSDGNVKGISVKLNLYTQNSGYNDAQKENIKREYKKFVSRVAGIAFDKVTVIGQIEKGTQIIVV